MRPCILNGIDNIAQRQDLLDRSIILNLPSIPENKRNDEETFWVEFQKSHSKILGGLCDMASGGLNELPNVKLKKKPRMADFAKWITACEKTLGWYDGEFVDIYNKNRSKAIDQGLESDPFATAVMELLNSTDKWVGNASKLLEEVGGFADERTKKSKAWPTSKSVRKRLKRINSSLEKKNILYVPLDSQMNKTLRLEKVLEYSNYRNEGHEISNDKGLDNDDIKRLRNITSSNDDVEKASLWYKANEINSNDDNDGNDDNTEQSIYEDEDLLI
jgi:hypothetical protein